MRPATTAPRATSGRLGAWAEDYACDYLYELGLECLDRNYRAAGGEIDLIMRDDSVVAFIEVRLRATRRFGGAALSVGRAKQQRIARAAQAWLARNPAMCTQNCRFDVFALQGRPPRPTVEWLRGAFDA